MSRPLRVEFAGAFYHVTARGNERKKIFVSQRDYVRFKEYLGIARERFGCVREVLQRLPADQLEREDVSFRKSLQVGSRAENVVQRVCAHHGCSTQDLNKKEHRRARDMAIYLLKRQTAASNREIGKMFDGLSYSAVAKICQRFGTRLQDDKALSLALEGLSRVKGYPFAFPLKHLARQIHSDVKRRCSSFLFALLFASGDLRR